MEVTARNRIWLAASLLIMLGLVMVIRLRLLQLPLERDEGEYAYAGQLLLQGVPPYKELYTMKWPGTSAVYAAVMALFGQTAGGIHAGLILINVTTALVVFCLARRIAGPVAGVVSAGTYALLSISPPTMGLAAHATHFVVLPALGGILLLVWQESPSTRRVFIAGLLLGLAALMKQPGIAFGLFAVLCLVLRERMLPSQDPRRLALRLAALVAGGLLPLALLCISFIFTGTFDRFWLWTVRYSQAYSAIMTPAQGFHLFLARGSELFQAAAGLWCAAGVGLVLLFCEPSLKPYRSFVSGLTLFSFSAVCAGWYFSGHYFLLLIPAAALLVGLAVEAACRLIARLLPMSRLSVLPLACFAAVAAWSVYQSRDIFFRLSSERVSRAIYESNPFPESVVLGRYLAANCSASGRVAVLGSEPEIFFYSHRRSALVITHIFFVLPLEFLHPHTSRSIAAIRAR